MEEDILFIIPAYNEEGTIQQVIEKVEESSPEDDSDILVVNDCSSDRTEQLALENGVKVATHSINLGGGAALRTGFKYAVRNGFDYVVCIDGDGQHNPKHIQKVSKPVIEKDADLCIGSRFLEEGGYKVPLLRKAGIVTYSIIASLLSGQSITDCTSGYRAINRDLFSHYADNYPDNFWAVEATIWAGRNGFNIEEVAVEMSERETGQSNLSPLKLMKYPFSMIYAILRAL